MRLATIALFPLLAAAALADEPPSADPVAAAKQDIAEMKAPGGQQDAAFALPSFDMRDMGPLLGVQRPDAPASTEKDPSLDPAKKKSGTGNWLIDAMDKRSDREKDGRSRDKDEATRADLDLLLGDRSANGSERDTLETDEAARDSQDAKDPDTRPSKAYNPLDSFMSSWISANDRELLVPSRQDLARSDLIPGLDSDPQALAADPGPGGSPEAAPFADSAPSNPYVGALEWVLEAQAKVPPLPGASDFDSILGPDVSKGLSAPAPEAAPRGDPRNFVPDFVQPNDDDKYFKQLKRF